MQRCRDAEMQRCRDAEMQRCRAEVELLRCHLGDAVVTTHSELNRILEYYEQSSTLSIGRTKRKKAFDQHFSQIFVLIWYLMYCPLEVT